VKLFRHEEFAYHKVGVVFWQTDEQDKPAILTEPYEKAFTAANVAKELTFYESELTFRVRVKARDGEKTVTLALAPKDNAAKKFKTVLDDRPEILSVEWTHRHYVQDDEYILHG
jgi:type I restriction enzyme M protein